MGMPGSGKSALLAQFYPECVREYPDALILSIFAGMSSRSTSTYWVLRRFVHGLKRAGRLDPQTPPDREALVAEFAEALAAVASKQRIVIILDAINQFESQSQELTWLKHPLPSHVRVVTSAIAEPPSQALVSLRWLHHPSELVLPWLCRDEAESVVSSVLREHRQTLKAEHIDGLLAKPDSGNPLWCGR
jgi:hypothetical protein